MSEYYNLTAAQIGYLRAVLLHRSYFSHLCHQHVLLATDASRLRATSVHMAIHPLWGNLFLQGNDTSKSVLS